jgi:anaerobic magnesium-protoporphyrin IX monomethyl ester cyclase
MLRKRNIIRRSDNKNKVILIKAGPSGGRYPHALLALAANLDDEVLILDEATPKLIMKHKDEINNALCVGISTMTGKHIKASLEVAESIRYINHKVPIIWGGWHPSLKPEQTLKNEYVDKVVVGQGEQAFHDVVENIKNGNKIENIITYKYTHKKNFPFYNLDVIKNMEGYITRFVSPRTITLYTSQGCPFGCEFCAINSLYGKNNSGWPIKYVISKIDHLIKKYDINGIQFDDDNFFIGKKRSLEFANQLLKRNININWSAAARADTLCNLESGDWEMLDRSGCKRLFVGAESGAQETLDRLNKKITPEMILEIASICPKYDIIPSFSFMVGVPGEKEENIDETFKIVDILRNKFTASEVQVFLYTPYPGTPLYDLSKEMGFKEPQSLLEWGEIYWEVLTVPWVDENLVERVKKYKRLLPPNRDISLKFRKKYRFIPRIYIQRFQYWIPVTISRFIKSKDKKSYLQHFLKVFLKRLILKKA